MYIHENSRISKAILFILIGLCSSIAPAEDIGGRMTDVLIAGKGRYVIANYTGPFMVVWDLDRLWEYLQPIQVHAFWGSARHSTDSMPVSAAPDSGWLASKHSESPMIAVCKMEPGFPCHFRIPVAAEHCGLKLSPDGRRLVINTGNEIQLVELFRKGIIHNRKKKQIDSDGYLEVDWKHGLIATRATEDSIIILNLENLEIIYRLNIAIEALNQIVFSGDGRHLIFCQEHWRQGKDLPERIVQVFDFSSKPLPAIKPGNLKGAEYIVPGDPGEYWSIENGLGDEWKLTLLSPSGEKTVQNITIHTDHESGIIAVSTYRGYILVKRNNQLYLWDIRTRLPMFELYNSNIRYWTNDGHLPHLTPGLGADPMFARLENLSFTAGFDDSYNRKRILFWLASLVTRRRTRYDRVWFSLLTELRTDNEIGREFLLLNDLAEILVRLNRAEFLLNCKQPEAAFKVTEHGLRWIRSFKDGISVIPQLNIYDQDIANLAANYCSVLEREFLLVQGLSASNLNKMKKAESAYRRTLEIEPQEWRAYSGLLLLHLKSDTTTFHSILAEAQQALRMKGWKDRPYLGYPDQFFDEKALTEIRAKMSNQ